MYCFYGQNYVMLFRWCNSRMSFVSWGHQINESTFFWSFDGVNLKTEISSNFPHRYVFSLGIYKKSIFVTGDDSQTFGLKTEKLETGAASWVQLDDYPFATDRFVQVFLHINEKSI